MVKHKPKFDNSVEKRVKKIKVKYIIGSGFIDPLRYEGVREDLKDLEQKYGVLLLFWATNKYFSHKREELSRKEKIKELQGELVELKKKR